MLYFSPFLFALDKDLKTNIRHSIKFNKDMLVKWLPTASFTTDAASLGIVHCTGT